MHVTVTRDDLRYARNEGTVVVLAGTETGTGDRITFAGDRRPMADLCHAVASDGEATAEVESCQVLRRQPLRRAYITRSSCGCPAAETVAAYLPGNAKEIQQEGG